MKTLISLVMMLCISMTSYAKETIRFATSATYPPFEFFDENNQIAGFDIDLAKALCHEMQINCTFTNQAFDSLIATLKFRRYDAVISGMDITAERSKQVLFTDPYYANSAIFIIRKDTVTTPEQLANKKVGLENGTTHQKYIHARQPAIQTVAYDSYQTAVIDLKNGRLDAVFGDTAAVTQWLKNDPSLTTVGDPVTDSEFFGSGLGIAVQASNTTLAERFNLALKRIKANGTYHAINEQWFPQ